MGGSVLPYTCLRFLSDLVKVLDLVLTDTAGSSKNVESSEDSEVKDSTIDSDA